MSWETLVRDLVGNVGLGGQIAADARNNYLGQQQQIAQTKMLETQLSAVQRAQLQQQQYDADVAEYLKNPTPEGVAALAAKYPEQAAVLKSGWQLRDGAARTADLRTQGSAYAAIKNKRPDLAIKTLTARRDAEKARGLDTSALDRMIETLASGDVAGVRAVEGMLLAEISAGSDPEKFGSTFKDVGGEVQGDFTLAPGGRRFRPDGTLIAEAPFAPRPVTVGEGETIVEYQPGGGGQASGSGGGGGAPVTGPAIEDIARNAVPGVVVTSRQRSPEKNAKVGGVSGSYHLTDQARDFIPPPGMTMGTLAATLRQTMPGFDVINEGDHVHVEPKTRGQTMPGGPRVIAQGPPKTTEQFRTLTQQEKVARGLNPSIAYQIAPNGQVTAIGGQDTKARQGRAIPDSTAKRVENAVGIREALDNALSSFQDGYAGNTLTGGLENTMQGLFGTGTPGQRDWWANFRQIDNQIRNDLFGSALTATEKAAYQATTINERMAPAEVRRNLQRRADIIRKALARQQNFLKKNGYDAEAVDALYGADALGGTQAAPGSRENPIPVRSKQEALRHSGKYVRTPDGRVGRVR